MSKASVADIIAWGLQGRKEKSEAPGQKGKTRHLQATRAETFQYLEIQIEKILLAYFMRPKRAIGVPLN